MNKDSTFYIPITKKYRFLERVSATNVSQVWRGEKIDNNQEITIKQTKLILKDNLFPPPVFHELVILSEINYLHIIRPYFNEISIDFDNQLISFCFEKHLISVQKIIRYYKKNNEVIPFISTKSILFQLLLAIDYLHSRKIAHGNIIPLNLVLVSENERIPGILKLMDFGYSRIIDDPNNKKSLNVVHPWYRAPEIILGDDLYDMSIDIWACGCVFAELLTGTVLFGSKKKETSQDLSRISLLLRLANLLGPISESDCLHPQNCAILPEFLQQQPPNLQNSLAFEVKTTPEAFDLLSKMLVYNPARRITPKEALNHPFFCTNPLCETNIVGTFPKKDWEAIVRQQQKQQPVQNLNTRSQPAANQANS